MNRCKRCGAEPSVIGLYCLGQMGHEFAPAVEKPKRLTVEAGLDWAGGYFAVVCVDGKTLIRDFSGDTEPEARAAAEAYVAELLAHFREGGT